MDCFMSPKGRREPSWARQWRPEPEWFFRNTRQETAFRAVQNASSSLPAGTCGL